MKTTDPPNDCPPQSGMLFRPFRACTKTERGSQTQAVGLGCASAPLRGSNTVHHRISCLPPTAYCLLPSARFGPRTVLSNRRRKNGRPGGGFLLFLHFDLR